jgi:hypothetical protein
MYNIKFTYLRSNGITEIVFEYEAYANSYEEAVQQVQAEADKRLEKMGGTIISIV